MPHAVCRVKQDRLEYLRFFCWLAARNGDCASIGPVWFVHSKSMGVVEGRWLRDMVCIGGPATMPWGMTNKRCRCASDARAAAGVALLLINTCVPGSQLRTSGARLNQVDGGCAVGSCARRHEHLTLTLPGEVRLELNSGMYEYRTLDVYKAPTCSVPW